MQHLGTQLGKRAKACSASVVDEDGDRRIARDPRFDASQILRLSEVGDEGVHFYICLLLYRLGDRIESRLLAAAEKIVSPFGQAGGAKCAYNSVTGAGIKRNIDRILLLGFSPRRLPTSATRFESAVCNIPNPSD